MVYIVDLDHLIRHEVRRLEKESNGKLKQLSELKVTGNKGAGQNKKILNLNIQTVFI